MADTLNKTELVAKIASSTGQSQATVDAVLNGLFDALAESVGSGTKVSIPGLARRRAHAPRRAHRPQPADRRHRSRSRPATRSRSRPARSSRLPPSRQTAFRRGVRREPCAPSPFSGRQPRRGRLAESDARPCSGGECTLEVCAGRGVNARVRARHWARAQSAASRLVRCPAQSACSALPCSCSSRSSRRSPRSRSAAVRRAARSRIRARRPLRGADREAPREPRRGRHDRRTRARRVGAEPQASRVRPRPRRRRRIAPP